MCETVTPDTLWPWNDSTPNINKSWAITLEELYFDLTTMSNIVAYRESCSPSLGRIIWHHFFAKLGGTCGTSALRDYVHTTWWEKQKRFWAYRNLGKAVINMNAPLFWIRILIPITPISPNKSLLCAQYQPIAIMTTAFTISIVIIKRIQWHQSSLIKKI